MPAAKVTILISIQNGAATLDRCFESIAKQSSQAFDVVCIDDMSTDKTPDLLRAWQKKFGSRLRVIRNTHNLRLMESLTKSLNKGLAMITSPYTARIDVDDWWDPTKLSKQLAFMEKHPDYGVIGCNYVNVGPKDEKKIVLPETDYELKRTIMTKNPFAHSAVLFRTELIKKMGGYDETVRYGQDYELWLRCLPHTKFHNLQEFLCYRTVGRGISVDKQREQMLVAIRVRAKYIKKYRLPLTSYFGLIEPFLLVVTPSPLKVLKRKLFG
jgi:glycosyltransferase involved in cell wall biosynthesis